jgi:hypothetical protein
MSVAATAMKSTTLPVERAFLARSRRSILALHPAPLCDHQRSPDFQ